jgi:hypothetical protein
MTRKELGAHLRACGFPISDSVLNKLCMPTVGQGPPILCWFGKRALYDPDEAIAWAEARTRPARSLRGETEHEAIRSRAVDGA